MECKEAKNKKQSKIQSGASLERRLVSLIRNKIKIKQDGSGFCEEWSIASASLLGSQSKKEAQLL